MTDHDMDVELSPAQFDLIEQHIDMPEQVVARFLRHRPMMRRHEDRLISAAMGNRGLIRASREYDPMRAPDFAPWARRLCRHAVSEEASRLIDESPPPVSDKPPVAGLDDKPIDPALPRYQSLHDEDDNGIRLGDKIAMNRRCSGGEPEDPLDKLIAQEEQEAVEKLANQQLYPVLLEYLSAVHATKQNVLKQWSDILEYPSPDALRKALERELAFLRDRLGEDYL